MTQPELMALPEGGLFHDRYQIVRRLRAGGMGAIYEVLDQKTRRHRALKVMLPSVVADPDMRARFKLEATITSEIDSVHVVETLDADVDAATGAPFVVMELLKGEDLGSVLAKRRAMPSGEVVELLHQASLALERTHAAGVIHRDLKPENLFLTRNDDGSSRLKVLDFGIAKIVADGATADVKATRAMGTPVYMPPEQIQGDGKIGPRADLYALGHIAFTLLVGEAYWEQDAREAPALYALCSRILMGAKEPAGARAARHGVTLPPAFDAWFAKATAVNPDERFETAPALVGALSSALGVSLPRLSMVGPAPATAATGLSGSPSTPVFGTTAGVASDTATKVPTRSRWPLVLVAVTITTGGGAAAVSLTGSPPASSARPAVTAPATGGTAPAPTATATATATSTVQVAPAGEAPAPAAATASASAAPSAMPARQTSPGFAATGTGPRPSAPIMRPKSPAAPAGGYDPTDVR